MSMRSVRREREARAGLGKVAVDGCGAEALLGEAAVADGDGVGDGCGVDGDVDDGCGGAMPGARAVPGVAGNLALTGAFGVRRGLNGDAELGDVLRHLPALMSTQELAGLTGMHVGSIRRGIAEGRIPADKVNGRWVIPAAFLLRNSYRCLDGVAAADEAAAEAMEAMRDMRDAEIDAAEAEALRAEKAWEAAARRAEKARARVALARRAAARDGRRGDGDEGMGGALCRV